MAILDASSVRAIWLDLTITLLDPAYGTSFVRHTKLSSGTSEADFVLHRFHRQVHQTDRIRQLVWQFAQIGTSDLDRLDTLRAARDELDR